MADLSTYQTVQENFFIDLNINGSHTRFSDYDIPYTIDGDEYDALGSLLGITNTNTNIRASAETLGITISGIPSTNLALVHSSNIKGSTLTVHRVFFSPTTAQLLSTTEENPTIKFRGMVTNFSVQEKWGDSGTFTLSLEVQNILSQLLKQTEGRRTNPLDEFKYFPSDKAFDRVPLIKNATFQFGAPLKEVKKGTTGGVRAGNPHQDQNKETKYSSPGNPHR